MKVSTAALGFVTAGMLLIPVAVKAENGNPTGFYAGAEAGLDFFEDNDNEEFEPGRYLAAKIGYRWSDHVRTELELSGGVADVDEPEDELKEVFYIRPGIAAYYDILPTSAKFVPYLGAGLGIAGLWVDDEDGVQDDGAGLSVFAEGGLTFNVSPHIAIAPSYRFSWIDVDSSVVAEDLNTHTIKVGLRVSF